MNIYDSLLYMLLNFFNRSEYWITKEVHVHCFYLPNFSIFE